MFKFKSFNAVNFAAASILKHVELANVSRPIVNLQLALGNCLFVFMSDHLSGNSSVHSTIHPLHPDLLE